MVQGDPRALVWSARLCCGLALLYVCVWRQISLIQVKAEHTAPRAFDSFVSCLQSSPLGNSSPCLPTFAIENTLILFLQAEVVRFLFASPLHSRNHPGPCYCLSDIRRYSHRKSGVLTQISATAPTESRVTVSQGDEKTQQCYGAGKQ